jgi:hypothetical protein
MAETDPRIKQQPGESYKDWVARQLRNEEESKRAYKENYVTRKDSSMDFRKRMHSALDRMLDSKGTKDGAWSAVKSAASKANSFVQSHTDSKKMDARINEIWVEVNDVPYRFFKPGQLEEAKMFAFNKGGATVVVESIETDGPDKGKRSYQRIKIKGY